MNKAHIQYTQSAPVQGLCAYSPTSGRVGIYQLPMYAASMNSKHRTCVNEAIFRTVLTTIMRELCAQDVRVTNCGIARLQRREITPIMSFGRRDFPLRTRSRSPSPITTAGCCGAASSRTRWWRRPRRSRTSWAFPSQSWAT